METAIGWIRAAQRTCGLTVFRMIQVTPWHRNTRRVNLGSGNRPLSGYLNIDINPGADLCLNLDTTDLPLADSSADAVVCMSAINYFTRQRASELIRETHRVLKPRGVARFGAQDMEMLARLYVNHDETFFMQKLPDGRERFEGPTLGDKFVAWFFGYAAGGHPCRYFYDYESLAWLFRQAGFSRVQRRNFMDSVLPEVKEIDNRPEQMFFLEAVK